MKRFPGQTPTILMALSFLCAAIAPAAAEDTPLPEGGFEQIDLFVGGEEGYLTYRIPAMTVTRDGTILAIVEARRNGPADHGDIDLVLKRSSDLGRTWEDPIIIYDRGGHTVGNPAPVVDRDTGTVWLPFTIDNDTVHVTKSEDGGETWSEPRDITADVKPGGWGWYATGPGHAIQLSSGRLLIPCGHKISSEGKMRSHVIYSDDHGETWHLGGSLPQHTDESMVVELAGGAVLINMRNNYMRGMRAIALSRDGGESWSGIKFDRELIEPVCQGSIIRYTREGDAGKNRILFSNPASRVREKMTVKLSYDEARSWPVAKLVNEGNSGYSDLAVLPDMTIALLYERGEKKYWEKISFARFTLHWLTDGEDNL